MGSFSMFLPAFSVIRSLLHSCDGGKMVCHVSGFSWEWGWTFHTFICNSFSSSLKRLFVSLPVFFCPPHPAPPAFGYLSYLLAALYTLQTAIHFGIMSAANPPPSFKFMPLFFFLCLPPINYHLLLCIHEFLL